MSSLVKILTQLGDEGPKAVLAVIGANCIANATIRPLITLSNPNETMESKKYAVLRESLTELMALPVVVGMGVAFKNWVSPAFFKQQSQEINKDVIRKMSAISGVTVGNLAIPFIATTVIGGLLKLVPSLQAQKTELIKQEIKKEIALKSAIAEHQAQDIYAFIERSAAHAVNPQRPLSAVSSQSYTAFRPLYRPPVL
jgi:hypothetical protein